MPACIFKFLAKRTLHLENQGVRFQYPGSLEMLMYLEDCAFDEP